MSLEEAIDIGSSHRVVMRMGLSQRREVESWKCGVEAGAPYFMCLDPDLQGGIL